MSLTPRDQEYKKKSKNVPPPTIFIRGYVFLRNIYSISSYKETDLKPI